MAINNIGQFLEVLEINVNTRVLLSFWYEEFKPEELVDYKAEPISRESLLGLRQAITGLFAERLQSVCTDAMWTRVNREYRQCIDQFDTLAQKCGITIGEPRDPVSITELLADSGVINVGRDGKVSLTPEGEKLADDVQQNEDEE